MKTAVLLPSSAPFAADQIDALNGVIGAASAEQRAWLSGFLAGLQAANDSRAAAPPAAPPAKRVPLTILFGTESGNAEALANQARKAASKLGFAPKVQDMADFTPAQAAGVENLLIVAATWGEGDPPQRAQDFYESLMANGAPRFEKTRYAVLALGDRAYAQFCEIGRRIDERLAALGGARIADRIECDVDYETPAQGWIDQTLQRLGAEAGAAGDTSVIHVDFVRSGSEAEADQPTRARPFAAEIIEHVRLSGSRSTSDTYHVGVSLEGSGITYEPGDALGVVPRNDPALVDAILDTAGQGGDAALRETLTQRLDITTLTAPQAETFARLTGTEVPPADWLAGRQVIDLLERAPGKLSTEQLTALLRPLTPRYYSIASSRKAVGEEAHLLVGAVRYRSHDRDRSGVASVDITERSRAGGHLHVFLRPNPHFRLPAEPDRKVIMVGPGTGLAPFRGFLQEREATGAQGANWLLFGHRNYTHDFLYQLEIQDWVKSGLLSRLDVAFSRDQPEKRYVQHALWDARRDLYAWLKDGASLYVCGDANAMARDVHAALLRVLADQGNQDEDAAKAELDAIRRDGRYLRDVY
ncbi:diflavin oxidoreductase [Rhodopila sp.]|uniref:diflavin oxidoreductase n=1 Tax=Rhodopila sp. TaxID=2480087 RepID=UPI002C63D851|nr:flavodoxin domain-containing protein [Rhodopila sp.]HVZ06332.1 flavodoxin domain-containing protein [Rhodopila sp.]